MRLGLPTSSAPSGVTVAALRPKRASRMAWAAAVDDLVAGLAAVLEREVVVLELEVDLGDRRVEHPQGLLEQLLAGLVALEHDDAQSGHRPDDTPVSAYPTERC